MRGTVDGPAKSKSPVENGGLSDPIIYKVSTIQDFATIYSTVVQCDDGVTTIGMNMFFHRNTILLLNNGITNEP